MPPIEMDQLFQRYYEKTASEAEVEALMQWMADPANEAELTRLMRGQWESLVPGERRMEAAQSQAMLNRILPEGAAPAVPQRRVVRLWAKAAVAASIILLLSAGAYFWQHRQPIPVAKATVPAIQNDVMPGGDKAVLTLANGSTVVLDSAGSGLVARQGATSVRKSADGRLVYDVAGPDRALGLNTITTPRGGQYQVVLPDGSKVWLNAASSLRFPTAFAGRDRPVILTGEAYFEVAKDRDRPFRVTVNGMTVKVLGTHFNVMAYDDEAAVKTSLLEGKVQVSHGEHSVLLSPSEQGRFEKAGAQLSVDKDANVDKAVAWKNGLFDFEQDDISSIMRQLARWYDIKVVYSGPVADHHYTGGIRRQVPISQVLQMLEQVGGVSFDISGNTVTVKTH